VKPFEASTHLVAPALPVHTGSVSSAQVTERNFNTEHALKTDTPIKLMEDEADANMEGNLSKPLQ
jgi:hypothetical protein